MDVAFSPDGTRLDPAGVDGCMKVWDAISNRDTIPIPAAPKTRHVMTFSPDGQIAQTGLHESTIHLWNTTTGGPLERPGLLDRFAHPGEGVLGPERGEGERVRSDIGGEAAPRAPHPLSPCSVRPIALVRSRPEV